MYVESDFDTNLDQLHGKLLLLLFSDKFLKTSYQELLTS